jgi:hypothetical protein
VLIGVLVVREVVQALVSLKRYLASLENWIEIIMIGNHNYYLFYFEVDVK